MRQRGFTLMEVLVAVAVLATALAAAIRVGSQAGSNTVELRERAYAGWVAENQLARIQSGIDPLDGPTHRSGATQMAGMEWDWELNAAQAAPPLPVNLDLPGLLEIEIEVFREGETEQPVAVRSLWYQVPRQLQEEDGDE
ncbi:type II secretion system minor pseudopilin GspI [Halorhodospira halochloris]|uniref:type II secretion system minor pseudopilin GspI n=1 Tax=Halorhodospira halochloris TaxID=1052 RepID=UPI001EE8004A|nr:type II secretion system minor pseudopilin GspI [Halorhodospira halochloris]MCG5529280.1 type II secretion system minor pseudopilin GspI [Halorhodospira halochloris]MCG5547255.1 type II secretion system minor pseudopilin GspI [Halorhodospira halochloris]